MRDFALFYRVGNNPSLNEIKTVYIIEPKKLKDVKNMKNRLKKATGIFLALLLVASVFAIIPPVETTAASQYVSSTVPGIYKPYIEKIKNAHPNWSFEFFYTGIDWNTAVTHENKDGINLISSSFPKSYRAIDSKSYNSATDNYYSKDAGGWYNAAYDTVAYYMDPRNFFDDEFIFQFEKLSYDSSFHNIDGVKSMLKGSFMDGVKIKNTSGSSVLYAQAYMDAAKKSGVSPYHLASRTIQEVGWSGSGSTSGTNSTYPGIYNFYNIGATSGDSPITSGLRWASSTTAGTYMRPWDSQYKSIVGGAMWIGDGFIGNKQNTLYLEKFDVVGDYNGSTLYSHQYMTSVTSAAYEGKSVYNNYKKLGVESNSFAFVIPVYNNMPINPSPKPIDSGSPWGWLSSLKVDNYFVSPNSTTQVTTNTFNVIIPNDVKKVTISAVPFKSNATVTGLAKKKSGKDPDTGVVSDVSSSLFVRTSPGVDGNNNKLKYNDEYVKIANGTVLTKTGQSTVDGQLWYKVKFSFSGTTLEGWVSAAYVTMDSAPVTYYESVYVNVGNNAFNIKVSSSNGSTRTYKLNIMRLEGDEEIDEPEVITTDDGLNTTYSVDQKHKFISDVASGTTIAQFVKNLGLPSKVTYNIYDGSGEVKKGNMKTGMKLTLTSNKITTAYFIAVSGDLNSDAAVDILDIVTVRNHIISTAPLKGVYAAAADVNKDGTIDILDLIEIRNITLG